MHNYQLKTFGIGLTQFATGIGGAFSSFMKEIFLTGAGTTESPYKLSVAGGIIIVFAAISLTIGLSKMIWYFLSSLGH